MFDQFARVYARGSHPDLSHQMADVLPSVMKHYKIPTNGSKKLLDIACGEGTFAVEMAKKGWVVMGIDLSEEMLRLANHRAKSENVTASFKQQDMRFLDFKDEFDLVTCWYGSLNFMTTNDDLQSTFNSISGALKPNGWFLFDINTVFGLAVKRQRESNFVAQETPELLELHCTQYDYEKNLSYLRITWFVKNGNLWERFEELFTERAFTIQEIESALEYAGLHIVDKFSNLGQQSPLVHDSSRAWFVVHKQC